jgi:ElaB/YqjD/DUF883 family membrane-anchored ribosome-binding protein
MLSKKPIPVRDRLIFALDVSSIDEAKRRISDVSTRTEAFVREHPGACLIGAVAVGYLIARLARR